MSADRVAAVWDALVQVALPRIDYHPLYFGKVIAWNDDQTVDVEPNDPKMPTLSNVPFRHGLPGVTMTVKPGTTVLVGFENGDPVMRFAGLWSGGEHVVKLTLNADQIFLGGEDGAEPAAKGQTLQTYLNRLAGLLTAHTHGIATDPTLASITPPVVTATNASVK